MPGQTLQNDLRKLRCHADILEMLGSMRGADMVEVYIEHQANAGDVPLSETDKQSLLVCMAVIGEQMPTKKIQCINTKNLGKEIGNEKGKWL